MSWTLPGLCVPNLIPYQSILYLVAKVVSLGHRLEHAILQESHWFAKLLFNMTYMILHDLALTCLSGLTSCSSLSWIFTEDKINFILFFHYSKSSCTFSLFFPISHSCFSALSKFHLSNIPQFCYLFPQGIPRRYRDVKLFSPVTLNI